MTTRIRCSECKKLLPQRNLMGDFYALWDLLEFLYTEESITEATFLTAVDRLLRFEELAEEHDREIEKAEEKEDATDEKKDDKGGEEVMTVKGNLTIEDCQNHIKEERERLAKTEYRLKYMEHIVISLHVPINPIHPDSKKITESCPSATEEIKMELDECPVLFGNVKKYLLKMQRSSEGGIEAFRDTIKQLRSAAKD